MPGHRAGVVGLGRVRGARVAAPQLAPDALAGRTWTRLAAEPSGLVNLAIANGIRDDRNTVWARTTIRADRARLLPMHLGFSDRVVVYLNGRALYAGDDTYRSRDYRFLGSIGWYDTVYLPLVEGANDLVDRGLGVRRRLGHPGPLRLAGWHFAGIAFGISISRPTRSGRTNVTTGRAAQPF